MLKALGLDYETKYLEFSKNEQKAPAFLALNPNGRLPALIDHSTNTTVWESKACMLYLVDKYDPEHEISVADAAAKVETLTYLFFQASGQGPYFGQGFHFKLFSKMRDLEQIPYAIKRYEDEVMRVNGVLETILASKPSGWLVGDKCTIADLAFVTWNVYGSGPLLPQGTDFKASFPHVSEWQDRMMALDYVKEAYADKEEAAKTHGM